MLLFGNWQLPVRAGMPAGMSYCSICNLFSLNEEVSGRKNFRVSLLSLSIIFTRVPSPSSTWRLKSAAVSSWQKPGGLFRWIQLTEAVRHKPASLEQSLEPIEKEECGRECRERAEGGSLPQTHLDSQQ